MSAGTITTAEPTLLGLLFQTVLADPERVLVVDAGKEATAEVTRRQFWQRTLTLRQDLQEAGVGRGQCIGVWLPNWSDSLAWQFAAASLGAHVIGINTRYNVDEAVHILDGARPDLIAVAHGFLKLDLRDRLHRSVAESAAPAPAVAVVTGPHGSVPLRDEVEAYDVGAGAWVPRPADPSSAIEMPVNDVDDPELSVVAFTTSGSTGKPKMAAHSSRGVVRHSLDVAAKGNWGPGDASMVVLPLSGVFGFVPAMAALAGGATIVLEAVFNENVVVEHMERFGVTHTVGGDDIALRVASAWRDNPRDLSRWRLQLIGDLYGRATEIAEWARDEFGTETCGIYGSSELFALTTFWPLETPIPQRWKAGGRLVTDDVRVRAADPVTDEPCPAGEAGELQFKGPNVVTEYLGNPEAAIKAFTRDGWFRSGDLGIVNEDGSVNYTSRLGDSLRLRGFLVEPAEIEMRLIAHPGINLTKVVGVQDSQGETHAIAFVVPEEGETLDPDEVRSWCSATLATHKVPRSVHVMDELPTTVGTNGSKIRTVELREMAHNLDSSLKEK